ncbi:MULTISPECIES: MGMT family protein [Kordiimonas]|jgi:methylated-DNA-protein-cysteine methyltransferase-like protein|uniref:MGMT family protein n=1 Tax=Kordiimonas TaxID=288021 RepID=UPI00257BE0A4|nr:MGMT family protein [Kordiimonas sp. UBA4487]
MTRTYASFPAVYDLVREIPKGQVASYGMVASLLPGVTPRIVGFAMAATPTGQGIPWQRVINSAGKISDRDGAMRQRKRLADEGITFKKNGAVDWAAHRWQGPSEAWLEAAGVDFMDFLTIQAGWPG